MKIYYLKALVPLDRLLEFVKRGGRRLSKKVNS